MMYQIHALVATFCMHFVTHLHCSCLAHSNSQGLDEWGLIVLCNGSLLQKLVYQLVRSCPCFNTTGCVMWPIKPDIMTKLLMYWFVLMLSRTAESQAQISEFQHSACAGIFWVQYLEQPNHVPVQIWITLGNLFQLRKQATSTYHWSATFYFISEYYCCS